MLIQLAAARLAAASSSVDFKGKSLLPGFITTERTLMWRPNAEIS